MNTSLLQLLVTNSHNKLRKKTKVASRHISFYHTTILKVHQIQLQKQSTKENIGKYDFKNTEKNLYVFFLKKKNQNHTTMTT